MTHREKILLVTSGFPTSKREGLNLFMFELARAQSANYDIIVLAPHTRGALRFEIWDGITIYRHSQFPLLPIEIAYKSGIAGNIQKNPLLLLAVPFFCLMQLVAIHRIAKQHLCSVLQTHWVLPQGFVGAIYKRFIAPKTLLISVAHGSDLKTLNNTIANAIKRFSLRIADMVITVSGDLREKALKLDAPAQTSVCPLGVDTEKFKPQKGTPSPLRRDTDATYMLFVGSLIPIKGIRDLLEALIKVKEEFPRVLLWIAGSGYLEDSLRAFVDSSAMGSNVEFLGNIHNDLLPQYYAAADLFVLPSYSEGFPISVKEAMSCGTPVLVSDLPAYTGDVALQRLIHTTPPGNPRQLATNIISLLKRREELKTLKEDIRTYSLQHMSWDTLAKTYHSITEALLQKR